MIRHLSSLLVLSALATPAIAQDAAPVPANVATAAQVAGPVQVNQGERFVPLRTGMALKAGDRVMALSKGSATLRFADGCDLRVNSETMVVVPKTSTCAGAIVAVQSTAPAGSGAVGSTAAAGGLADSPALIIGMGVVGDAILFAQEDQNNTASP
jgi:hypothetical protein